MGSLGRAMRLAFPVFLWLFFFVKAYDPVWADAPAGGYAEYGIQPQSLGVKPWKNNGWSTEALSQNQPNPASHFTVIYFSVAHSGPASLKLYNALGREIGYFVDDFCEAGTYRVRFAVDILAKGQYYYQLKTADYVYVKKMIIVK